MAAAPGSPPGQPTCGARRRAGGERSPGAAGAGPGGAGGEPRGARGGGGGEVGVRRGGEGREGKGRGRRRRRRREPPGEGASGGGALLPPLGAPGRCRCGGGPGPRPAGAILCCFIRRRRWLKSTSPSPAGRGGSAGREPGTFSAASEAVFILQRQTLPLLPSPLLSPPCPFSCFLHLRGWLAAVLALTQVRNKQSHQPARPPSPPSAALLSPAVRPPATTPAPKRWRRQTRRPGCRLGPLVCGSEIHHGFPLPFCLPAPCVPPPCGCPVYIELLPLSNIDSARMGRCFPAPRHRLSI